MSQNRQFSILLILITSLIFFFINGSFFFTIHTIIIFLFLALNLVFPDNIFNIEVKNLWMKLGYVVHLFFSSFILIFIYFVVITPISFFMKLFKYNPLLLNTKPKWSNRNKNEDINFNDLF